jgi:hypothetical protein
MKYGKDYIIIPEKWELDIKDNILKIVEEAVLVSLREMTSAEVTKLCEIMSDFISYRTEYLNYKTRK